MVFYGNASTTGDGVRRPTGGLYHGWDSRSYLGLRIGDSRSPFREESRKHSSVKRMKIDTYKEARARVIERFGEFFEKQGWKLVDNGKDHPVLEAPMQGV